MGEYGLKKTKLYEFPSLIQLHWLDFHSQNRFQLKWPRGVKTDSLEMLKNSFIVEKS